MKYGIMMRVNGVCADPDEYGGNAYHDSVGEAGHRYFREGNLRLPINYTG